MMRYVSGQWKAGEAFDGLSVRDLEEEQESQNLSCYSEENYKRVNCSQLHYYCQGSWEHCIAVILQNIPAHAIELYHFCWKFPNESVVCFKSILFFDQ